MWCYYEATQGPGGEVRDGTTIPARRRLADAEADRMVPERWGGQL